MTEQLLKIDGQRFEVMLIKISRSASILDKYAKRTINGDLQREIILRSKDTLKILFPDF